MTSSKRSKFPYRERITSDPPLQSWISAKWEKHRKKVLPVSLILALSGGIFATRAKIKSAYEHHVEASSKERCLDTEKVTDELKTGLDQVKENYAPDCGKGLESLTKARIELNTKTSCLDPENMEALELNFTALKYRLMEKSCLPKEKSPEENGIVKKESKMEQNASQNKCTPHIEKITHELKTGLDQVKENYAPDCGEGLQSLTKATMELNAQRSCLNGEDVKALELNFTALKYRLMEKSCLPKEKSPEENKPKN